MKNNRSGKRMINTSKFISLILRHRPGIIGITLDEHGWADVQELISGVNNSEGHTLDMIRANQGHSVPVDVELEEKVPPAILWHGTGEKFVPSIDKQGLIPKGRLYVHLSSDTETARKVGSRHGKPVIYEIDCRKMGEDGYRFYLSENGIWLTKSVPAKYMKKESNG